MRAGTSNLNRTDSPVWDGPRPHLQPCGHVYDYAERLILIEPVIGLDMCCRCGAVFGRNPDLATEGDFSRIVAAYAERESKSPTRTRVIHSMEALYVNVDSLPPREP